MSSMPGIVPKCMPLPMECSLYW